MYLLKEEKSEDAESGLVSNKSKFRHYLHITRILFLPYCECDKQNSNKNIDFNLFLSVG